MVEDTFAKNAQGISKIYHGVSLLMKLLQTKSYVRSMNISYYDLYYTVIKNRNEKNVIVKDNEIDYINSDDSISPNHYNGRKINNQILR